MGLIDKLLEKTQNSIKEYNQYRNAKKIVQDYLKKPKSMFSYFKGSEIITSDIHDARMTLAQYEIKRGSFSNVFKNMFMPHYFRK